MIHHDDLLIHDDNNSDEDYSSCCFLRHSSVFLWTFTTSALVLVLSHQVTAASSATHGDVSSLTVTSPFTLLSVVGEGIGKQQQQGMPVLADGAAALVDGSVSGNGGIIATVRTVALAVTGILFLFYGLTFLAARVIMPAAAKELQSECQEIAPGLWEEYVAKLEPGQTMGGRPDPMQELGEKLQPLLDVKIADMEANGIVSPFLRGVGVGGVGGDEAPRRTKTNGTTVTMTNKNRVLRKNKHNKMHCIRHTARRGTAEVMPVIISQRGKRGARMTKQNNNNNNFYIYNGTTMTTTP